MSDDEDDVEAAEEESTAPDKMPISTMKSHLGRRCKGLSNQEVVNLYAKTYGSIMGEADNGAIHVPME